MALVIVTGGARSGKSSAAQRLAGARAEQLGGAQVVVAVFGRASDAEMRARIAAHQEQRPEEFDTLEVREADSWLAEVGPEAILVVECLGTLLGLLMERSWPHGHQLSEAPAEGLPEGYAETVEERFMSLVDEILYREGDTIVVTNEVGLAPVPPWATGRLFQDLLGLGSRRLVADADAAYLYVAGRAIDLKKQPAALAWPED